MKRYSIKKAAEIFGRSESAIRIWISKGRIRSFRDPGGGVWIPEDAIPQEFMEEAEQP